MITTRAHREIAVAAPGHVATVRRVFVNQLRRCSPGLTIRRGGWAIDEDRGCQLMNADEREPLQLLALSASLPGQLVFAFARRGQDCD